MEKTLTERMTELNTNKETIIAIQACEDHSLVYMNGEAADISFSVTAALLCNNAVADIIISAVCYAASKNERISRSLLLGLQTADAILK